ncbi:prolipoprotein diacylglyceryl transferase [Rhizomonospora bruguierae]|uniref:prolipoprotein diacylglyceryl transferase n=1 Tax=Rhizomonospora bruguierae TaxID=1581705 RepID=UPI0020BE972B|nr:prolipoprotein diacylglyceryl transferase [Micromonospora sp. NBRC 107566]
MTIASIPSPTTAVWHVGVLPLRAYALCIIAGIVVACVVTERRMRRRGVQPWAVLDLAVWAVPFGIVGARIYHIATSWQDYFGAGREPLKALFIWEGGLGIWGAVAGGAVGAWLGCRQLGIPLSVLADSFAPGLPLAQAVGRVGNWFNNELYGGRTTLPWGLQIHDMDPNNPGHAATDADGKPILLEGLYHPTFLYEAIWDVGVAVLVFALDRRFKFGRGRAFALYVMGYTAGRAWIEAMRTDPANHILGVRLNVWTALLVFIGALIYFLRVRGAREYLVPASAITAAPAAVPAAVAAGGATGAATPAEGEGEPPPTGGEGPGYRVVSEAQFHRYQASGVVPPDDEDDGADLIDPDRPPLDEFADDSDDEVQIPDEGPDDPPEGGPERADEEPSAK